MSVHSKLCPLFSPKWRRTLLKPSLYWDHVASKNFDRKLRISEIIDNYCSRQDCQIRILEGRQEGNKWFKPTLKEICSFVLFSGTLSVLMELGWLSKLECCCVRQVVTIQFHISLGVHLLSVRGQNHYLEILFPPKPVSLLNCSHWW